MGEVWAETQGRILDAGTEAGPWRKAAYWFVLHEFIQLAFLQTPGPPSQGWYHPQWAGPPKSIINLKRVPQTCLQANLVEIFSQLRLLLPR